MTEVRARAARQKGHLNFESEIRNFLYAFGDDAEPLSETIRILDEITTDFIIETCHSAARTATYSNRQKIKVDDFKFAIRNHEAMLGRVQHLLTTEVELKKQRNQHFGDVAQGRVGLERAGRAVADAILKDERGGDAGGSDGKAGARRNRKSKVRKERV